MRIQPLSDFLLNTVKSTAADKEDILGIYRNHLLVGVLTASLRRDIHHRTLKQFQQSLLYTFTTHIASNRRVIPFTGYLVNLIDKHDPLFRFGYIIICHLKQTG